MLKDMIIDMYMDTKNKIVTLELSHITILATRRFLLLTLSSDDFI